MIDAKSSMGSGSHRHPW